MGRGPLKIFLGYSAGVGKSSHLFDEGQRLRARGEDIVVATDAIDVPALLQRHPHICIVDALAHDNPPGSRHAKRYEDVEELLDAGIGVLAAIDIEAVEEQQPFVARVTGHTRAETVPQRVIESADDIVLIDAAPDVRAARAQQLTLLRERARQLAAAVGERQLDAFLARHHMPPQRADARILVCITPHTNVEPMLASTRREAAGCHIDVFKFDDEPACGAILEYARRHDITQLFIGQEQKDHQHPWRARLGWTLIDRLIEHAGNLEIRVFPDSTAPTPDARERLLLCIEPDPASAALIQRARGIARRVDARCFAVFASHTRDLGDFGDLAPDARDLVERLLNFARALGMDARILDGDSRDRAGDSADEAVAFARQYDVHRIFVLSHANEAHANGGLGRVFRRRGFVQRIVHLATDMQVHILSHETAD